MVISKYCLTSQTEVALESQSATFTRLTRDAHFS